MNRRRTIFVTGAVSALGFCCLGPPAQAQTQTQTFDVPSLGSPASFLTFEQFDDTVPCRILQEVRLSCDWTVSGDFSFTNDAEFDCTGTATLIHTEELVFPFPGGSIECSSGGDETVPIGPNLPPGGTDFFPGIIDITYTDSVSFTTDLSPFIGAGTVDARISSQLLVGLQVPCDNTNSTDTIWTGTITLEYIFVVPESPVCTVTGDDRVCEGDSGTLTVMATGGAPPYTYLWSTGEMTDTITVSATDTYCCTVTDALGCVSDPCCFDFAINPNPTCEITGDARVCEGDSGTLTVTGLGGTGPYTYLWSTGETTDTIQVSMPDTYCCVVTDALGCESEPCCFDFAVNPNPTCEITGDDRVCEGDSGTLTVMGMGGTGPYTYLWSTGETTQSISVSVADTYCCVVTDALGCESEPCCFDFAVNPNPTCEITGDDRVCEGDSGTLTVMGMGGTGPYTYLWSTGETTQSISVSTEGMYSCTVTDANGCASDPCFFVFAVNPNPTCEITGDDRVCEGDSGTLTVIGLGGTGPYTYLWSTGETTDTIQVSMPDTYCCVVTDALGCESEPCCFDFAVNPNPTCEITGDDRVCEGDSGTLTVQGLGGTGPYTYLWSTGETTQSISVSTPDTYCCVVTDALGCESEPCCFDFAVNPNSTCEITGDDRVCEGDSGTLTVTGMGGAEPYTYLWSTGETTQSISVSVADTYCCVVTDANGCESEPCCFDFAVNPNPVCEITGDDRVCDGDSGTLTVTGMGGTGPYTYLWSTGEMTQSIAVSAPDTYCCVVTDANGCESEPCCFDFSLNPNPTCEITGDDRVCEGGTGMLTVTGMGGTGPYTYLWSTGEMTQSISVSAPDTYCCVVTDANGCESEPCCFDFAVNPNPVCEITGDDRACEGDSGTLTVMGMGGTGPYTYLWSTGEMTQSISVSTPGTYCCTVTDANGCMSEPCCFDFSLNPNPVCEIIPPSELPFCETSGNELMVVGAGGTPPYSFMWSLTTSGGWSIDSGGDTDTITYTVGPDGSTATFSVTVTDANGCMSTMPCTLDLECFCVDIGDFVWFDADGDGCQDPDEPGLPDITVNLYSDCDMPMFVATTITNGSGFYFFEVCEPGEYLVEFVAPDGFEETVPNACDDGMGGNDDENDSDCVDGVVCVMVTEEDFTIDCGFGNCEVFCDLEFVEIPPDGDAMGCTPGYWKQEHHFFAWTMPYTPDTYFGDVFEDAFPGDTLLDVVSQGGGHLVALGRHTVAALLNAASPGVDYELTVDEVIDMFDDAYPGSNSDYNALKDYFEDFNEQGCGLGNGSGDDNGDGNGNGTGDGTLVRVLFGVEPDASCADVTAFIDIGCATIPVEDGQVVDISCEPPPAEGCRFTGGGNNGHEAGVNRYTFGGQAGAPTASQPQPCGEWTHRQHNGPDGKFTFHAGTASAPDDTEIDLIECSDFETCTPSGNPPSPAKQLDFEGVGSFRNVHNPSPPLQGVVAGESLHWFHVHVEDLGEPGNQGDPGPNCPPTGSAGGVADCDCPDFYYIRIHETADPSSPVIYEEYTYLNGGNFQLHSETSGGGNCGHNDINGSGSGDGSGGDGTDFCSYEFVDGVLVIRSEMAELVVVGTDATGGEVFEVCDLCEFIGEGGGPIEPLEPLEIVAEMPPCPEDLNGDRMVDEQELEIIFAAWGPSDGDPADVTGDGVVDGDDLVRIVLRWGACD